MRKNKKLFAILTLVAFMMTLMPVLAFGATTAVTNNGVTFSVENDGDVVVTPTNSTEYVFSVANNTMSDVTITVNGSAGNLTVSAANVAGDNKYYGSSTQSSSLTGGASAGADITGATVQIPAAIKTESAANKAEYDLITAANSAATTFKGATTAANARDFYKKYNAVSDKSKLNADAQSYIGLAENTLTTDLDAKAVALQAAFLNLTNASVLQTIANTAVTADYTATLNSVVNGQGAISNLGIVTQQPTAVTGITLNYTVADKDTKATKTVAVTASVAADSTNATTVAGAAAALNGATLNVTKGAATVAIPAAAQDGAGNITFQLLSVSDSIKDNVASAAAAAAGTIGTFKTTTTAATGTAQVRITGDGSTVTDGPQTVTVTLVFVSTDTTQTTTGVSVDASIIATKDANASVEAAGSVRQEDNKTLTYVDDNRNRVALPDTKYAEIELVLRQANNASFNGSANVYVWAEESGKSRQATDALVIDKGSVASSDYNVYLIPVNSLETIQAAFLRAGTYTIKASIENPTTGSGAGAGLLASNTSTFKTVTNKNTITAVSLAQKTREFKVDVATGKDGTNFIAKNLGDGDRTTDSKVVDKDNGYVRVAADTVATTKVSLTVRNNAGNLMTTYPVRLSTNSGNIDLDETNVTTDYKGVAEFNIAGLREGEYKVYVNIGDYEATIMVQVGATSANNIELIKFPSNPIATDTLVADYKDIFRFQLTDANGNIVKNNYNGSSYAALTAPTSEKSSSEQAKYAYIVSAPEANKVKNADLKLWYPGEDKDYYTLAIDGNKSFSAEGDYEIRVVLNNGKSVTLNFSVKKFDKAISLHIEYPTSAVELNSTTDVPDIYFLDANRVMKKANNRVTVAAQGYAVASVEPNGQKAGQLRIKNDEKYVGQTITVTAASDKENLMASTTLTVADEAREVKLDTNRGPVNANNRVGFKVVDSTGAPVALGKDATVEVTAVVTNTGDPDAKVSYSVTSSSRNDLKEKGTGIINLSANKQTTATVQIMVKVEKPVTNAGDNNTGLSTTYYSGTETFTFGAEADKSVVMTIGSKEIVAQNVPVTIDVAPFIQDNRTYVPFRALVEAFGAEVDYNADNNTVTTKLDGKTVVLTVGSTVLTVNDETVTMDVAPFIVDDRVVVPVRFVGEAFGFTVEATQDADTGATASVVFYQK